MTFILFLTLIQPGAPPVFRQTEVPTLEECFKSAAAVMAEYAAKPEKPTGAFQTGCMIITK